MGKFTLKQEVVQNSQALCFTMYNKNRPQLWPPLEGSHPVKQLKRLRAQLDDARVSTSFYFLYPICVVSGHPPGGQPRPSHLSWDGFLVMSVSEAKRFWRNKAWWYVPLIPTCKKITSVRPAWATEMDPVSKINKAAFKNFEIALQ